MKVLFTHRFFFPDTAPYATMLRDIAEFAVEEGQEVHIFSSVVSYRSAGEFSPSYESDELNIKRIWVFLNEKSNILKRVANVLIYCFGLFFHILKLRPDVVTASTYPPIFCGWFASLACKIVGAKFIYHLQDIHPEVSHYSGGRLGKGIVFRILRSIDNQTLKRTEEIVVLSEDMATTIQGRGVADSKVRIINNLALNPHESEVLPPDNLRKPKGTTRVIFAGNLGKFQNLQALSEGVSRLFESHKDLELFFLGSGSMLDSLKERWAGNEQVKFAPFLPYSAAKVLIEESDVGLVSLSKDLYKVAYPSKIISYADLGLPMLVLVERESKLAKGIESRGLGQVPESSSPEDIALTLSSMLSAKKTGKSKSEVQSVKSQWIGLLRDLEPKPVLKKDSI